MHRPFIHWLLIVLLLASQGVLAAHEADVDAHADGEYCSVCLLSSAVDNTSPGVTGFLPDAAATRHEPVSDEQARAAQSPATYRSRAPPHKHSAIH